MVKVLYCYSTTPVLRDFTCAAYYQGQNCMIRIKLGLSRIRSGWIAPRFMQVVFYLAHRSGGGGGESVEPEPVRRGWPRRRRRCRGWILGFRMHVRDAGAREEGASPSYSQILYDLGCIGHIGGPTSVGGTCQSESQSIQGHRQITANHQKFRANNASWV
jgi:hypothetical protein